MRRVLRALRRITQDSLNAGKAPVSLPCPVARQALQQHQPWPLLMTLLEIRRKERLVPSMVGARPTLGATTWGRILAMPVLVAEVAAVVVPQQGQDWPFRLTELQPPTMQLVAVEFLQLFRTHPRLGLQPRRPQQFGFHQPTLAALPGDCLPP